MGQISKQSQVQLMVGTRGQGLYEFTDRVSHCDGLVVKGQWGEVHMGLSAGCSGAAGESESPVIHELMEKSLCDLSIS